MILQLWQDSTINLSYRYHLKGQLVEFLVLGHQFALGSANRQEERRHFANCYLEIPD